MTGDATRTVLSAIEQRASEIIAIGCSLSRTPELGYCETRSAAIAAEWLSGLGLAVERHAATGVTALIEGRSKTPVIALVGELDAIHCPEHPAADPATGAAHACGHHAGVAAVCGAAAGLTACDAVRELDGSIKIILAPAEEYVDVRLRKRMVDTSVISFFGGKQELIARGLFSGVAAAVITHPAPLSAAGSLVGATNGVTAHLVTGERRALEAAVNEIEDLNRSRKSQRLGLGFNAGIVADQEGEYVVAYARASTLIGLSEARGMIGARLAGRVSGVAVTSLPGYLPRRRCPALDLVCWRSLRAEFGGALCRPGPSDGSTDAGDLSMFVPTAIVLTGSARGEPHSATFRIHDERMAYVAAARVLARTACELLTGNAAARIAANYRAPLSGPQDLLALWDRVLSSSSPRHPRR